MDHQPDTAAQTIGKLLIVWVSTITGLKLTEWAALFAIVYTLLQIVVLVRDKFLKKRRDK